MPTITKTIGTTGRDYSTIAAWEADLDDSGIYSSGDDAVGELYDDSVFDAFTTINGGGTIGLASITLTVAATDRHDGTAGTGARLGYTGGNSVILTCDPGDTINVACRWFEIFNDGGTANRALSFAGANICEVSRGIFHKLRSPLVKGGAANEPYFFNNVLYDPGSLNDGSTFAMIDSSQNLFATSYVINNTIFGSGNGTNAGAGVQYGMNEDRFDNANMVLKNNLVLDFEQDFGDDNYTLADVGSNASADTSASGAGAVTGVSAAAVFVSTINGSEDLHLVAGATAVIDQGVDLGTTPTGVELDIDGRDRDAEGDTWDIGADEFVAAAGRVTKNTRPWPLGMEIGMGWVMPNQV